MPKIYKKQMTWEEIAFSKSGIKLTIINKNGKIKVYNIRSLWHSRVEKKYKVKYHDFTIDTFKESDIDSINWE